MKMHPRADVVSKARLEIQEAVMSAIGKHHLTYPEIFSILGFMVSTWAKWALKDEREA